MIYLSAIFLTVPDVGCGRVGDASRRNLDVAALILITCSRTSYK